MHINDSRQNLSKKYLQNTPHVDILITINIIKIIL